MTMYIMKIPLRIYMQCSFHSHRALLPAVRGTTCLPRYNAIAFIIHGVQMSEGVRRRRATPAIYHGILDWFVRENLSGAVPSSIHQYRTSKIGEKKIMDLFRKQGKDN